MDFLGIPPETLGIGSGWMLVGVAVWMLYTGRLIPKRMHDEKVHEANEWRTESRIKDQQIAELSDSLRTLGGEMAPLVETTMRQIQKRSGQKRPGHRGPEEPS